MIYADINVAMHAVGRPHRLREEARERFIHSPHNTDELWTYDRALKAASGRG